MSRKPPLASRLYSDHAWPFQLARYLLIGSFVTAIDVGSFALLLQIHWPLLAVISVSYSLAVALHFSLNKYFNFRAHHRPLHDQAFVYGLVALFCWVTTTLIVTGSVRLGVPPLIGKCAAVGVNIPLGFLGHRFLTFGRSVR